MIKTFIFTNYKIENKGFTLVELLVSLALFVSIITIATGSLFSAQAANVKLEQTQIILDGVNLALEVISRDVLYGTSFYCGSSIPVVIISSPKSCSYDSTLGGSVIVFRPSVKLNNSNNQNLDRIAYFVLNGIVYKDEYAEGNVNNKKTYQVTPPDVFVDRLTFFVTGAEGSQSTPQNFSQPIISISVSGKTTPTGTSAKSVPFNVQTSISARRLDN